MNSVLIRPRWFTVLLLITTMALSACATGPRGSYHTFSFDGWFDKWAPEVDLLAYDYGGVYGMVRKTTEPEDRTLGYRTGVHATMPSGDYLYVKWRIKSTDEIVEDKVDLRKLLPQNMFEHTVTFVIDGHQLIVYLVTPKAKSMTAPPVLKTYLSKYNATFEIYPNNTFKQ